MQAEQAAPKTIDEYIAAFPPHVQEILEQIRTVIREAAPGVEEAISYQIPAFNLNGHYLVYFAAYKKHIGLYPAPTGVPEFEQDVATYGAGKGTLRFPLDKPIPYDLIRRIVHYRVAQNLDKPAAKRTGKKERA